MAEAMASTAKAMHKMNKAVDVPAINKMMAEYQITALQAQMNPHFIFNALNSIRALVDENPERARTAITELSNILRSSMQAEKLETVTLEKSPFTKFKL